MSTSQDMANLDTDTSPSSIPSREQRGRVYDRPTGPTGTKNNMAMIIGLILAAIAVVILLALLF